MRPSQKVSLGAFLCLSLVMACLAVIRASKIHGATAIDVVWEFYWQYIETVVAVIMGSITVIRNLLVHQKESNYNSPAGVPNACAPGQGRQDGYRMQFLPRHKDKDIDHYTPFHLPTVPAAALTRVDMFIRHNQREPTYGTQITSTSTLVQDESYQQLSRNEPQMLQYSYHDIYQVRDLSDNNMLKCLTY